MICSSREEQKEIPLTPLTVAYRGETRGRSLIDGACMLDISHLKAAFERTITAFNLRELDALVASAHDRVVLTGAFSPFSAEGKDAVRQVYETFFANYERTTFATVSAQFHVVGSTGVAWGYYALTAKLMDGPAKASYGRYTLTFAQSDGKWTLVAAHFSWLPSGT